MPKRLMQEDVFSSGNKKISEEKKVLGLVKRIGGYSIISFVCLSSLLTACGRGESSSGAGSGFTGNYILSGFSTWQLILLVFLAIIIVIPYWKITEKAGYSGWLALLILVPGINLIYVYFLAFSNWPRLRKDM